MIGGNMTGKELKAIRKRMKKTQWDFGVLLGFHHPQIRVSELERGVRKVSQLKELIIKNF
jgi:DNA-binding transcriptional regulator YiaG